jgi:hypothetical protein
MPVTRVVPGQPLNISATDWNDLLAMTREWKGRKQRHLVTGMRNLHTGINAGGGRLSRILVSNESGSDVPPLGILALEQPQRATTDDDWLDSLFETPQFKGITPTSSYYGKWAVVQEPAVYDNSNPKPLYWAVASGITWANVNIQDTQDVAVEHNNATNELVTQMHGSARILWKPSGTGSGQIALIQMGDWVTEMLCKTNAAHAKNASQAVSVWLPDRSADTLVDVTAINLAATSIASGKWCGVTSYLGNLVITWAECP